MPEHLENSGIVLPRWQRVALSVLVTAIVAMVLISNLPASPLQSRLARKASPVLVATGLDQDWAVFAPPRHTSIGFYATATTDSGQQVRWDVPSGGSAVGAYWDYRWRKLVEHVDADAGAALWRPFARYIARDLSKRGLAVTSVTLVRTWRNSRSPTDYSPAQLLNRYAFYTAKSKDLS